MPYKWAPVPEGLHRPGCKDIKEHTAVEMNYPGLTRQPGKPHPGAGGGILHELRAEWALDDSRIQFGGWDGSARGVGYFDKSDLQRQCLCFPASSSHLGILVKQFGVINPSLHTLKSAPSKFLRCFPAHGTAQAPSALRSGVIFTPSRTCVES